MAFKGLVLFKKLGWPDGPWMTEPDFVSWIDEAAGLPCVVQRNPILGVFNGYVGVPEGHAEFGMDGCDLCVHGGVTLTGKIPNITKVFTAVAAVERAHIKLAFDGKLEYPEGFWWFGFDCAHGWDHTPGTHALLNKIAKFGLDLDSSPYNSKGGIPIDEPPPTISYKSVTYVRKECADLAIQLATMPEG